MSDYLASIGIEDIQLVPKLSLDTLSSETLGLIAGYCELQHVALLFCCGSRLLNAKLSSRTGAQSIQSARDSRSEWNRFPALLGQLKGLKSICLESLAPLTSVESWWSDLVDLLPISIEDLSLTVLHPITSVDMELLHPRLQTLKSLFLSFENSSGAFEFPLPPNWSDCFLTKLALDFRFISPSVIAFPATLTDLCWGGESEKHSLTGDAPFEGCKHLIRLRLPFMTELRSYELPATLKCLEIPSLLQIQTITDGRVEIWDLDSLAFSAFLPPNLEHFESADAVTWSSASCDKTMISWKLKDERFRPSQILEFPSNLQTFIVVSEPSFLRPDSTYANLLALLPPTITDLRLPKLQSENFIDSPLPPHLTHLSMTCHPLSTFKANFPISLTSLHMETSLEDPKVQSTESIRRSIITSTLPLPPHITHFSTSAARFVKLSESDKLAFKWDSPSNWISPLLIVVHDRIDIMYECFERGWYQESDFEDWDPLMGAIKHGSLKFLKWALSRHFMTSYHFFTAREGPNSRALLLTAISNGQLEVIEMLESKGFDTSPTPTSTAITGAIQSNRPEILAWLTKRGIDFTTLELNTGPLADPLTVALRPPCRASAAYLLSVGCVAINFMSFLLDKLSLNLAHELGLFAPFETPENVAHYIKHWNPARIPSERPSAAVWQTKNHLENPPLRFRIMFLLLHMDPRGLISIFHWMSAHGYWDPLELIEPSSSSTASISASEPTETTQNAANGSQTSTKTEFAPTFMAPIARRTVISFYLEYLSQYAHGATDVVVGETTQGVCEWLFDWDPLIERLRYGDNKTIFDFMGPEWVFKPTKSQIQARSYTTTTHKPVRSQPAPSSSNTSDALPNPTTSIASPPKTGFKSSATFGANPTKFGATPTKFGAKSSSSPPTVAGTTTFGTPAFKTKLDPKK